MRDNFVTSMTFYARIAVGILLVICAVLPGVLGRSPWLILGLSLVFTVLYFQGKRAAIQAWRNGQRKAIIDALPVTWFTQLVLCGIFYLIGRGIGSLLGRHLTTSLAGFDDIYLLAVAVGGIIVGQIIVMIEDRVAKNPPILLSETKQEAIDMATPKCPKWVMEFDEAPITLDNFFTGYYYGHYNYITKNGDLGDELTDEALSSPQKIQAAEERLGIKFPPLLRQLYARQNGGMVGDLWVPRIANPTEDYEDWCGAFSHDYCYLTPLDKLRTLYDSYLGYLNEDEIEAGMQDGSLCKDARRYVILCQRYADTTFLDYSQSDDNPRVGVVDFERVEKQNVWFDSFDSFFAALKRGELERPR